MIRGTPLRDWGLWALGFLAGSALATWLTLCTLTAAAQSPDVQAAMESASATYGVPYATLRRLALCESRFRPWVDNEQGSGAMGLYQFMPRTWAWMSHQAGWGGSSPYDPWAAAHVTAWALSRGYGRHWSCW